jgi:hypothetical protein
MIYLKIFVSVSLSWIRLVWIGLLTKEFYSTFYMSKLFLIYFVFISFYIIELASECLLKPFNPNAFLGLDELNLYSKGLIGTLLDWVMLCIMASAGLLFITVLYWRTNVFPNREPSNILFEFCILSINFYFTNIKYKQQKKGK